MLLNMHIKNYTPLSQKGVKEITLNPVGMFNVLLARNGYGKTSLLRETTPLPPDNARYDDEGYKCSEYQINGNHYKLESWTGKKSVHHFFLNGENLNKGKTLNVQKELVRLHFGLTNELKNVLTGLDKSDVFSSMSTQRRKSILMEINPNDTRYALSIYEKIRIKHNQTKGALKHQRQRLVSELRRQEELHLLPIDELQYEIKLLDDQIKDALLLHGELMQINDPDIEPKVKHLAKLIATLLSGISDTTYPVSHWLGLKERYTKRLETALINKGCTEALIHKITERLSDVSPDSTIDIDGYKQKIDNLTILIHELDDKITSDKGIIEREVFFTEHPFHTNSIIKELPSIIEHVINIDVTTDEEMTAGLFTSLVEAEKGIQKEVDALEHNLREIKHQLDHFHSASVIDCPNCQKGFKPGLSHINPLLLETSLSNGKAKHETLTKKQQRIKKRIESNEGWYYGMLSFMRYIKSTQNADFFMQLIKTYHVGKVNPHKLITVLEIIIRFAETCEDKALKEIERKTLVAQYQLLNRDSIKSLYRELDEHNLSLSITQRWIKEYLALIKECENNIDKIKAESFARDNFIVCFDEIMQLLEEKGKYYIKQAVEKRVNELTPRKNALVTKLIRSQSLVSVIDDIEKQVELLDTKEKHLSFLLDSLSPTKGMIGHLMLRFLDSLCANVNAVIERIWSDPLRLQSPKIDEENKDLDYKFRVITTNPNKPIQDIKECSGGEKDIIDFAIRYTLMRYTKGKTGLPFCLDEIGASFDELHKRSYSNYIATERRSGRLPQTFLISHFVTQYGAFNANEANIIKLNTEGLIMPEGGNEQVIIK